MPEKEKVVEMEIIGKSRSSNNLNSDKTVNRNRRTWITVALALYITLLLLSTIPFMADKVIEPNMKETYVYHLIYRQDGKQTHYYVERENTGQVGKIDLEYITDTNTLDVQTKNINVLRIYCRSMYEDECKKVFDFDPIDNYNYYKWYFIEKNHLTVYVETDNKIKELAFIDTPIPYQVIVNGKLWTEGEKYNYSNSYKTVLSDVPKGTSQVDIYFKSFDLNRPLASFTTDTTMINVNTLLTFDASSSFDPDGEIIAYIWDFSDGQKSGGVVNAHSWSKPGVYCVILTVRDNDYLIDHAFKNITVVQGTTKPIINGIVPNQEKTEDASPWELDLTDYGIDLDSSQYELRWYLTGENTSLYKVVGENSSDQKLIFSPVLNAYGNNLARLWLKDKDGQNASQPLWINITSVNDKPRIDRLPDLAIHYNLPYRFLLTNYLYDVETPPEELEVDAYDQYGNLYVKVYGQELILDYPEWLINEIILVTITVSDGEDTTESIISVTISDNWPPIIISELPDVTLYEGESLFDVFNLDYYFNDPEDDDLYYTYGESHVRIYIKSNNSVDIFSRGDWTGTDSVIFRARDPIGSFVEDMINVTVIPLNDPPKIDKVPDLKVHFDMDYYFDLAYYISDSDNSLIELKLKTSDPKHIRISPSNNLGIILNYPKSMLNNTTRVKITVSDGMLSTSGYVNVTVIEAFPPELIQKLPDITFDEDEELIDFFNLGEYFLDLDNDTLFYTTGNKMVNITIGPNHLVSFSAPTDWFGMEKVIFRATDPGGALVEDSIYVTVIPVNDAPVIKPLPKVTLNESEIIWLDLEPYIFDVDSDISNINITVDNENIKVSGINLVIFGSPELPKEVFIYVSDGELITEGVLQIKVTSPSVKEENLSQVLISFVIFLIMIIIIILLILVYVYRRRQRYNVEEIFLIHNSGKLLKHVGYKTHSKIDNDIFSGMFTAIQGFIEESFTTNSNLKSTKLGHTLKSGKESQEKDGKKSLKLNEFKVGENQVIIEDGEFTYMAVVYKGPGAMALHHVIKQSLTEIENKYNEQMEYWDGDISHFKDLDNYMNKLISKNNTKTAEENIQNQVD